MHGKQERKETRNQEAQKESSQASPAKARRASDRVTDCETSNDALVGRPAERFIKMLFDYYDITPLVDEAEWNRILAKNDKAFVEMSTWG